MWTWIRYSVFLVIGTAIVAEIFLRIFDPIGIEYAFEIHRYFKTHEPDERFAYINRPNLEGRFQGVEIAINGDGFRWQELSAASPDNTDKKRIMILGDSIVFGWGARFEDIFPSRLQAMLERENMSAEVIPVGVCSWNTRTQYEFLRAKGLEYKPDLLVLVIAPNDTEIKREGRTDIPRRKSGKGTREKNVMQNVVEDVWRDARRNSYLFASIQWLSELSLDKNAQSGVALDNPGWKDAEMALGGIIEFAREHGIELMIYLFQSDLTETPRPPFDLYDKYLTAQDIATLSLPDSVFSDRRYQNSMVDLHPNALGHDLIAERMLYDLKSRPEPNQGL